MKRIGGYLLLSTMLLGSIMLASCANDKTKSVEEIVIENLEYRTFGYGITSQDSGNADSNSMSGLINSYYHRTEPALKYVNLNDKLDIEIYMGFENGINDGIKYDIKTGTLIVDRDQEITLKLYREFQWHGNPVSSDVKRLGPIVTEIYSFKEKLGFFIDGEFNKDLKTIKYEDIVPMEELHKNYYDCGSKPVRILGDNNEIFYEKRNNYCDLSYYYTLSCDENDYIKYYRENIQSVIVTSEDGYVNPFGGPDYKEVNTIRFYRRSIYLESIDGKLMSRWEKDGIKHYY